jgi:hypothetical protein
MKLEIREQYREAVWNGTETEESGWTISIYNVIAPWRAQGTIKRSKHDDGRNHWKAQRGYRIVDTPQEAVQEILDCY